MTSTTFAERLRAAMEPPDGPHWTAPRLAVKTGLSLDTIRSYRMGRRDHPSHDALTRLADALQIPVSDLQPTAHVASPPAPEGTP